MNFRAVGPAAALLVLIITLGSQSVSWPFDLISLINAQSNRLPNPTDAAQTESASGRRPQPNRRPRALIAPVRGTVLDEPITLDGSKSFDPDGHRLFFRWTLLSSPSGSRAAISPSTEAIAAFTPDVAGLYRVQLTVSDGLLTDSANDSVRVRNRRPRAVITPVGPQFVTQTVMLDGTGSSDPDGDSLAFRWRFLAKPRQSRAVLINATTATPTFVVDRPGTYQVLLDVSDGSASDRARVRIQTINSPPVANAGPDQTVVANVTVTLDGSASADVDGDRLAFRWDFVSAPPGSRASLSDATAVRPRFFIDVEGTYVLRLIVRDGRLWSAPDYITVSTRNSTPVANAGPDQTVARETLVRLDASGSTDADGDPLTYLWAFVAVPMGSTAVLSDAMMVQATFVADVRGDFVVRLTVSDGRSASQDTITITTENSQPVANAGVDRTSPLGATLALDGSASTDVDGDSLTYQWSLIKVPVSSKATLSDPSAISPTFVVDLPGEYVAQLMVNDGLAASEPDAVTISTENTRPIADAGPDQSVIEGAIVLLDGSGSSDPDSDVLGYTWSLTAVPPGSTAALSDATSIIPSFTADRPGMYVAQLVVDDGRLSSVPDTVIITTTMNTLPVANAGADQPGVAVGALVTLDGSDSSDADDHDLTFQWSLLSVPDGSQVALSNPTAVQPTFVPDLPGTYVAQLIVHDGLFPSAPDTVQIEVRATNRAPVADAGPDRSVIVGESAVLDGTGSSDPDGDSLTYAWTLTSVPPGSAATLVNPTSATPTLTPDVAGDYIISLVVNDGLIDSAAATAVVTASGVQAPPTIIGFTPTSGRAGDVVSVSGTNFVGVLSVAFNGVVVPGFTVLGSTSITVPVPGSATTGPIAVTTTAGSAASTGHFVVVPSQDFQLTAAPDLITVPSGGQGAFQISLTGTGGFTNLATLAVIGVPAGAIAAFGAATLTSGQGTQLTVQTAGVASGSFELTVTATGTVNDEQVSRTAVVTLQIAAPGVTSIAGQFLTVSEVPIPNVLVQIGAVQTHSDAAGNFLLQNVADGLQALMIDANVAVAGYPIYKVDLQVVAGQALTLPTFRITPPPPPERYTPFNNATAPQIITDPRFPGFELTLPAGARIIGWDGTAKSRVAIERILPGDLPVPLPPGPTQSLYQIHFGTPMGGIPSARLPVTLPNDQGMNPGQQAEVWWYDAAPTGGPGAWKMAGMATVSADGTKVVSNPGVGIDRFCGVCGLVCIINRQDNQDNRNLDSPMDGDPVDLASGQMIVTKTDLVLPGRVPALIHRTYNPTDPFGGIAGFQSALGAGWTLSVEVIMLQVNATLRRLVLPGNARVDFVRTGDDRFVSAHRRFSGAVLTGQGGGEHRLRFKDGRVWRFDGSFLPGVDFLVEEIDRNGNRLSIERTSGAITRIVEPSGRALSFTYAGGRISQIADPLGRVVRYSYNSAGLLETVTDAAGGTTRYTYNAAGGILTITDARGIDYIRNEYSPLSGRILRQVQADGSAWEFRYRAPVRWLQGRGPFEVLEERLDNVNQLGHSLFSPGFCSPNGCSPGWLGDLKTSPFNTTVINPVGRATTHLLSHGFSNAITDALGQVTRFTRDANGNVLTTTDPLGRKTRFDYDELGNVTRVIDPQDNVSTLAYDATFNKVTSITDAVGNVTTFAYDARGNLTRVTDPEQNSAPESERRSTTIAYNAVGQPASITDPVGNVTRFTYDEDGNVASIADPLGNTSRLLYDAVSRIIAQIDPRGGTAGFTYDALNQITNITDALGRETSFSYDANGNLLTLSDARQSTVHYEYDVMDRLTRRVDQLGRVETFAHDANGNVTTTTDRKGQAATVRYDALDRPVEARFADGAVVNYQYDAVGRLVSADDSADPHRPITLGYDVLDRVEVETTTLGSVRYAYDPIGRRTQMLASGAEPVTYEYDRSSRLRSITQAPLKSAIIDYDAADRRTMLTLPNGVSTEYEYDQASRLTELIYRGALGPLGNLTYQYDRAGNRVGVGGSLARSQLPEPVAQAQYDAANQQLAAGDRQLTYDANGNLLSLTDPGGQTLYAWDARDRLVNLTAPGTAGSFAYDAFGRRASKNFNGRSTQFAYDGLDFISEVTNGAPVSYLRSLVIDEALVRNGTEHYVADALGSTVALTDPSGLVATLYAYEPFGITAAFGASTDNPIQFTGRENDGAGLYFYRARYYSPSLQRFYSEDPAGFEGGDANLYGYVNNNPSNFTDPFGLWTWGDPLPDWVVDSSAGFGDALTLGGTSWIRDQMGTNDVVDRCSTAYKAGGWATLGLGVGRLAYAGAAKAVSLARGVTGAQAVSARNALKVAFRGGLFPRYRIYSYSQMLERYGTDAAVKAAAGRTNSALNFGGAYAAGAGAIAIAGRGKCP